MKTGFSNGKLEKLLFGRRPFNPLGKRDRVDSRGEVPILLIDLNPQEEPCIP